MSVKFEEIFFNIRLTIFNSNVVELCYPPEIELTLEQAEIIDQAIYSTTAGENIYLLINFENSFGNLPSEVQNYFAKEAPTIPQVKASAIVLNNLPVRILAKFYLRVFKPSYTSKIFSTYEEAWKWLEKMQEITAKTESIKSH